MDKSQQLLEIEIEQLKSRVEFEPETVLATAEQCATRANQILYPEGVIASLILMSRCYWALMDYRKGLKCIRDAHTKISQIDNDDCLPEILHIHALHYWGHAKYYSAQQFWIQTLEQASFVDQVEFQIEALIGLGNVWRITDEYNLALTTHELAVKVANNKRIDWLEGKAQILLAWDHYLLNNYIEMLSILDSAAENLGDHNDKTWQAEIWDFRGLALLGLERLDDAEIATQKAHDLVVENDLTWMKAHSYISRARLELLRKDATKATELLTIAEQSADSFDNGELLSQIYFQQSVVAEEIGEYRIALDAFKKYRTHSNEMLREQTFREGSDRARSSKRILEQRARKLINRIRAQYEYDPNNHLSQMVSETYWWEQLVLFKTELKKSNHAVIMIHHSDPRCLEICAELAHSMCNPEDLISRLSSERLGILLAEKDTEASDFFRVLAQMIEIYPWHRKGIKHSLPKVELQDILTFPFTLDQLEESQVGI
ncbi:hypothetical protein [Vibrio intestinalis]|uniref:hypothetical protein n=1 Tax=Vibrio intestinalis TaxID=2933291 RepID=UPI0021A62655|nr:hypothetical protein [Vibrio intestinalis]